MQRWITDTEPSARFPLYTRANAGEVLPEPVSPLAWSLVWEPGVVMGWADTQVNVGTFEREDMDPVLPEVVGCFGGYLYINVAMARIFGVRAPGLSPEMIDYVYFGQHPDVPPYVPEPWHENEASSARVGAWMGQVLVAEDLPHLRSDRDEAAAARASRPDLGAVTDEELVARARSFVPLIRRLFERHLEVTAATAIGTGVLAAIAAALGDDQLPLTLVSGVGDVDSAVPTHDLWALSRQVRASAELTAAFDGPLAGLAARVDALAGSAADAFRAGFATFLRDQGSRGPNEWDIRSDTWETEPALALALIERMRLTDDSAAPEAGGAANAASREAATARVEAALAGDPAALAQFRAGLHSARLYLAGRERTKTTIIRVIHEVRMAVRELGARHGYPPSATCMLLADELDAFVNEPDELAPRLAAREQQYLTLFELDPPFIIHGTVPPLDQWPRRSTAAAAGAATSPSARSSPGCRAAPGRPPAGPASCCTRPIRPGWSRATSSWRPSPIPRGRRCSYPPQPSWSTSVRRSATQ